MRIISVINYKGGVGKTSVTANLAGELAYRGRKILLIDLDPQASLTFSLIKPEEWKADFEKSGTIKNWFDSMEDGNPISLNDLIYSPEKTKKILEDRGKLNLIPSHLGLINVDLELATELGGANIKQSKRKYLKVHKRLFDGLKSIDKELYDIVLIDCPPNFNIVTKNAIVASDYILIPAKPDYLSTLGIDYLIRSLDELVNNFNDFAESGSGDEVERTIKPEILGVIFTMVQFYSNRPIATIRPFIAQTKSLDIPVFASYIRENKTMFADAPQYGVPVVLSNTISETYRQVVEEIKEFVTEFEKKLNL
ncbi:MAG: AAA family ATPase [Deltaproteobacteria bacterium]|nr:AAA family ATPase [Deltaproteobacteria bacterium]